MADSSRYVIVSDFHEGLARIESEESNSKSGFINERDEIILPCIYEAAGDFKHGLAWIATEDGYEGYIDKKGNMVIPTIFYMAWSFGNEFDGAGNMKIWALVQINRHGKKFFMDRDLNYYDLETKKHIYCEEGCPRTNDKIITGFCCKLND